MEIDAVGEAMHRQPFPIFTLKLADGRELPVKHRDFIAVPPVGRRIAVFGDGASSAIHEPLVIASIDFPASQSAPPQARQGNGEPSRMAESLCSDA
jgi:hypothetical protein